MLIYDGKGPQTPNGILNKMYSKKSPDDQGDGRKSVKTSYIEKYEESQKKPKKSKKWRRQKCRRPLSNLKK